MFAVERIPTAGMTRVPRGGRPGGSPDLDLLAFGDLEIEGRLLAASNATLRARVQDGAVQARCVVKPVAGERPLWDFPDQTLTGREVAAHAVSELLGWSLVPPTVWREDTPVGPAMVQRWIDEVDEARPVDVLRPDEVPTGWAAVLEARDQNDEPVVLAHDRRADLMRMAVFDVVVNNADRKGGHVLADADNRLWAIDHGVTFSVEEKLRTVLWGWAGEALPEDLRDELVGLARALGERVETVDRFLDDEESSALRQRVIRLVETGRFPLPSSQWPAVPWPVF